MGSVMNMQDINKGRKTNNIEWAEVRYNKDGQPIPLKIWENLECILNYHNIDVRLNLIDHEIYYTNLNSYGRNSKLTDIYSLQMKEGLNLSRDETIASIKRIAEKHQYNPFIEMLEENENDDFDIIYEVFECLNIPDSDVNKPFYFTLFSKWCINVVRMAHNTLEKRWEAQGILVLQGLQGEYKSTFCQNLMSNPKWFKGGKSLQPDKVDSIVENTRYILVEWGELDSTLKGDQAKLKAFISESVDEYRSPYERLPEAYPRITSYISTVNVEDFLKDETGSRRYWVIPISTINRDKIIAIDKERFWGTVYSLWKSEEVEYFLTKAEREQLAKLNRTYNYQNDVSIKLQDKIDWDMPEDEWCVYKPTEIADYLCISELKKLKIELQKLGIEYKVYRKGSRTIRGYKIPRINLNIY